MALRLCGAAAATLLSTYADEVVMSRTKTLLLTLSGVLVAECVWLYRYLTDRAESVEMVGGALLLIGTLTLGTSSWILFQLRGVARAVLGLGVAFLSFFLLFLAYAFLVRW